MTRRDNFLISSTFSLKKKCVKFMIDYLEGMGWGREKRNEEM